MNPEVKNLAVNKVISFLIIYFIITLAAKADSNSNNMIDMNNKNYPSSIQSQNIAITFSSHSPITYATCPTTTSPYIAPISSPTMMNTIPTPSGAYNDENFNSILVPEVPAYYTCYYIITYVKNRYVESAEAAMSKMMYGDMTVPTFAKACPSSLFNNAVDGTGAMLHCQIGEATAIYQYTSETVPQNNTSICYDDTSVQSALNPTSGICSISNGKHIIVAASGTPSVYLIPNSGYSYADIPKCSQGVYRLYIPTNEVRVSYAAVYFQMIKGQLAPTCTPQTPGYTMDVEQDVYDTPSGIIITRGLKNIWTIGPPNNTLSSLCYGNCTWHHNEVICAPNDCAPDHERPPLNIAPQTVDAQPYS